jgi:hypothetical protein
VWRGLSGQSQPMSASSFCASYHATDLTQPGMGNLGMLCPERRQKPFPQADPSHPREPSNYLRNEARLALPSHCRHPPPSWLWVLSASPVSLSLCLVRT